MGGGAPACRGAGLAPGGGGADQMPGERRRPPVRARMPTAGFSAGCALPRFTAGRRLGGFRVYSRAADGCARPGRVKPEVSVAIGSSREGCKASALVGFAGWHSGAVSSEHAWKQQDARYPVRARARQSRPRTPFAWLPFSDRSYLVGCAQRP